MFYKIIMVDTSRLTLNQTLQIPLTITTCNQIPSKHLPYAWNTFQWSYLHCLYKKYMYLSNKKKKSSRKEMNALKILMPRISKTNELYVLNNFKIQKFPWFNCSIKAVNILLSMYLYVIMYVVHNLTIQGQHPVL